MRVRTGTTREDRIEGIIRTEEEKMKEQIKTETETKKEKEKTREKEDQTESLGTNEMKEMRDPESTEKVIKDLFRHK